MDKNRQRDFHLKNYINPSTIFYRFMIPYYYKTNDSIYEHYIKWLNYLKKYKVKIVIYNTNNSLFVHDKHLSISSEIKYIINN